MREEVRIGARVSEVAYGGWAGIAQEHSVSISALIEAVGLWLAEAPEPLDDVVRRLVLSARAIDKARRSR